MASADLIQSTMELNEALSTELKRSAAKATSSAIATVVADE
jgi:hypothetical protein